MHNKQFCCSWMLGERLKGQNVTLSTARVYENKVTFSLLG